MNYSILFLKELKNKKRAKTKYYIKEWSFLIINLLKLDRIIDDLADSIIRGDFRNSDKRKVNLGALYPFVENRVNEKLGYSKSIPYW